jgi:signal transduction histidine kinase
VTPTTPVTLDDLRRVDLFDGLDEAELEQWCAAAQAFHVPAGKIIAEQDASPRGLLLLLEGRLRTYKVVDETRFEPIGHMDAPTWMQAIAALTETPVGVRLQTETDCTVGLVPLATFTDLALSHRSVHRKVMQAIGPVTARLAQIDNDRERLASLGTMAAGLAHELNNPAAAASRAAAQLEEALDVIANALASFVDAGVERAEAAKLVELQREAQNGADGRTALDALDAADAEDDLLDRLEALDVPDAWRLAEPLAGAGVTPEWLERVHAAVGPATGVALRWIAATLAARGLAGELQESTRRMSSLVGSVKAYAYMDRGGLVEVDLHEGLETTLAVLAHKLKHTRIEVVRDYDRELPKATVHGSELNQVWTNLLDNAIDALGESGTIMIATRRDGSCAEIDITDDGPGIPDDIREHVFDSFFTTKDVGHGTGLGLATARRIVVDRHDGTLAVESAPGRTTFRVRLPIR